MKRLVIFLGLIALLARADDSVPKNEAIEIIQKDLKVSVIIPCHYGHAKHLYALLRILENQTLLPDEVVISLSESHKVLPIIFDMLQQEKWSFPIVLVTSEEQLYAGQNRNRACEHAMGDVFICQDADDIPHPQRVEIIKYIFQRYDPDHLMHQYVFQYYGASISFQYHTTLDRAVLFNPKKRKDAWKMGFTNGNVAINRRVFNTIKWGNNRRGQDTIFNNEVYAHFEKPVALKIPLLVYRVFLSSAEENWEYRGRLASYEYEQPSDVLPDFETRNPEAKQYSIKIINPHPKDGGLLLRLSRPSGLASYGGQAGAVENKEFDTLRHAQGERT